MHQTMGIHQNCSLVLQQLSNPATATEEKKRPMAILLTPAQSQDLADVLPYLACGEVSAVHAFTGRLFKGVPVNAQVILRAIAQDEMAHAQLIDALQQSLPPAKSLPDAGRLAMFFKRLESSDPAEHLARVAALDRAVCQLLQPLLRQGAALSQCPDIYAALCGLRQDEARHVRMARDVASQLGISTAHQLQLNRTVRARLQRLLAPVQSALERLSAKSTPSAPEPWMS